MATAAAQDAVYTRRTVLAVPAAHAAPPPSSSVATTTAGAAAAATHAPSMHIHRTGSVDISWSGTEGRPQQQPQQQRSPATSPSSRASRTSRDGRTSFGSHHDRSVVGNSGDRGSPARGHGHRLSGASLSASLRSSNGERAVTGGARGVHQQYHQKHEKRQHRAADDDLLQRSIDAEMRRSTEVRRAAEMNLHYSLCVCVCVVCCICLYSS